MEMGILKESTAIVIRQLSLLYYCGNGQRNFGGPQPSGSKKDLFLISELKQRCGSLWVCTAETIKEPYGYGR